MDEHSKNAVMQSKMYLGDSENVYTSILRKNLYAVIFMVLSVIVGVISLWAGIYMKKVWAKDTCKSLRSLGIYSICAGSWILTDSKIFLLIAQKTGMIEQISFLCFFSCRFRCWNLQRRSCRRKSRCCSFFRICSL